MMASPNDWLRASYPATEPGTIEHSDIQRFGSGNRDAISKRETKR
jgi:hypothetical protein